MYPDQILVHCSLSRTGHWRFAAQPGNESARNDVYQLCSTIILRSLWPNCSNAFQAVLNKTSRPALLVVEAKVTGIFSCDFSVPVPSSLLVQPASARLPQGADSQQRKN